MTCIPSNGRCMCLLCAHCSKYPFPPPHSSPVLKFRKNAFVSWCWISTLIYLITICSVWVHCWPQAHSRHTTRNDHHSHSTTMLYWIHLITCLSSLLEHTCLDGRGNVFTLSPSSHLICSTFNKWWLDRWMDNLMYGLKKYSLGQYEKVYRHRANSLRHLTKGKRWG